MKNYKFVLANALALTGGIYYAICYIFALIAPQLFLQITKSWFHMIEINKIARLTTFSIQEFIFGLLTFTVNAWILGFLFGWSIERFSKKNK